MGKFTNKVVVNVDPCVIRFLRRKFRLDPDTVARKLNISKKLYRDLEFGKFKITIGVIKRLAQAFEINPSDFFISDIYDHYEYNPFSGVTIVNDVGEMLKVLRGRWISSSIIRVVDRKVDVSVVTYRRKADKLRKRLEKIKKKCEEIFPGLSFDFAVINLGWCNCNKRS
ncbi:MAG: helix-turn-helix domain-containing protein [Candidatus Kryptonium sp.]|nr:helix-turn-helix domain-containing protein [Candidatus Kryptonium sp.]